MPRKHRWRESPVKHGIVTVDLFDWKYFNDFIYHRLLDHEHYVFRGHRRDAWELKSTLDRAGGSEANRATHLETFRLAIRGRRGSNPAKLETENDWWALGQHHGLRTPLLDWTKSPFVAAYFAFIGSKPDDTNNRVVWALSRLAIERRSAEITNAHRVTILSPRPPIIEFFTPLSDENPRLVNQGGLFSRAPDRMTVEKWMETAFTAGITNADKMVAIKITIPSSNREQALTSLNRMNINHLTLFPDLYGASAFCNTKHEIAGY